MIQINFINQQQKDITHYEKTIDHVFQTMEDNVELNIIFVDDDQMKSFNQQFRNIDKTTDVLTFPSDDENMESIGDIIINIDKVIEQAKDYGHSELREVAFLAVHGYLHILGYDHHTEDEERVMIDKQNSILNDAGLER